MRIDKFLKVSRLVKRREVAKELCEDGDVLLNGKVAKAMTEVKEGDSLILILGNRKIHALIREVRPYAKKEEASEMVEITMIEDERKENSL